jgi:radical SAM protein with 4Fe4S-binding SPASM domain
LREKDFINGNILVEGFSEILERGRVSKTRVKAYEIPKCRDCPFVATCAGGCRASAFYNLGTCAAEDEFCDILYKFEVDKLFLRKNIPFHL